VSKLILIYWRDIPAQVLGRRGRKSVFKRTLTPRFQETIDRAAMRARKTSADSYMEDWRRVSEPCEGDLEAAVDEKVAMLEREYSDARLDAMARAAGLAAPAKDAPSGPGQPAPGGQEHAS
jgi:hypothetical protein